MPSVSIHPPKTPVTEGSMGIAKATIPNVCKMPGPPAPFVPSPLPNIAKSSMSPKGYSTTVKIEGNKVAIRGATFASMGDEASKGTGGGLVSANTAGPAKFITPGSMTVKIQGKSVHLLGEPMLNNCGPSGSPPNTGATMQGLNQYSLDASDAEKALQDIMCECHQETPMPTDSKGLELGCREHGIDKHACCEEKIQNHKGPPDLGGERGYDKRGKALTQSREALKASGGLVKDMVFPDACALSNGAPSQFFDFKFPCAGEADTDFYFKKKRGLTQFDRYKRLSDQLNIDKDPKVITSRACR